MSVRYSCYILTGLVVCAMFLSGCVFTNSEHNYDYSTCNTTDMVIAFLDVGHGDCTIIIDGDTTIVVDTGSGFANEKVLNYLYKMSVEDIDYMFVTHPHADHDGGVSAIYNYYPVHNYYDNKNASRGQRYPVDPVDNMYIYILNPSKGKTYTNINDESIVMMITKGEFELLMTGDVEKAAENDMIKNGLYLDADVLKVAHHGSKTSTSEALLDKLTPEIAIVSAGKDNRYNHPSDEVLELLKTREIKVYETLGKGDVRIRSDGMGFEVY